MGTRKNATVSVSDILAMVQGRSEWSARATSVANPERVAILTDAGMFTSDGIKLRAYVKASGVALLETNEEYKVRKGIARDAKIARKTSAPTASAPVAQPAPAPRVTNRKNDGKALDALANALGTPVESGDTDSATKNATISAIDRKCETLGVDRAFIESQSGYTLADCTVRQLRKINAVLGERIARNAKRG